WGVLTSALGYDSAPNTIDRDTVISIDFLSSANIARIVNLLPTETVGLLSDDPRIDDVEFNLILVGQELVQFREVEIIGTVVHFRDLYRARGRTASFMEHTIGESCLFPDETVLRYTSPRGGLAGKDV